VQYHIKLSAGDVGGYALLPGDPGRVEIIAQHLERPRKVAANREFVTWVGELEGEPVAVSSTGVGGPSAAICVQELARIGVHTFLRVGTCGLLQIPRSQPGDLVVATASVRGGATPDAYVPLAFPAVADPDLVMSLRAAARGMGLRHHVGMIQCKDAFYLEEPACLPDGARVEAQWETWRRANVLASEMESDTLFVLGSIYGLRTGTLLLGLGGLFGGEDSEAMAHGVERVDDLVRCAVEGLRLRIVADHAEGRAPGRNPSVLEP